MSRDPLIADDELSAFRAAGWELVSARPEQEFFFYVVRGTFEDASRRCELFASRFGVRLSFICSEHKCKVEATMSSQDSMDAIAALALELTRKEKHTC